MHHKIEIMAQEVVVIYYSIEKNHAEIDNAPADIQTPQITNIKQEHNFTPLYLILKALDL